MAEIIPDDNDCHPFYQGDEGEVNKFYFSAAAVAIQFPTRLGSETLSHLRNIVIQEDECSIADPESHAKGLIPFCLANMQLRILRRVDLWHTTLVRASDK